MSKTTVIYHSADFDGIFCREIARKFLTGCELIGWNFGDPKIPFPTEGQCYVLDLPPDCLEVAVPTEPLTDCKSRMVWIDHHKSSIEKWSNDIPGYRIDGVAACRLVWQWFRFNGEPSSTKQHFVGRIVDEPIAVQLAGEYDVWDKRNPWSDLFQYGLRSVEPDWTRLLGDGGDAKDDDYVLSVINAGETSKRYAETVDAGKMKASFVRKFEGLNFLCLNGRGNSMTFSSLDVPETGHDALMMFYYNGKKWVVSLYHAKHRTELDLSQIAARLGGGGHRGACGFTTDCFPVAL